MGKSSNAAKPLSSICLNLLVVSRFETALPLWTREKGGGRERPPPKQGGHAVPHSSGILWHASVPAPMGSLPSSFIPAGRLGKTPFPLALHCVGSVGMTVYEGKGGYRYQPVTLYLI